MSDPSFQIERLRALLAGTNDPAQRLLLEQIMASFDAERTHDQQVGDGAQVGAAIAGDNRGTVTVDQSTRDTQTQGGDYAGRDIDKRIVNIVLAGNDAEAIISTLAAAGMTLDPKLFFQFSHRKQADRLLTACANISWPITALHSSFSKIAPYHRIPDSTERTLLQSMLYELADNTIGGGDPIAQFVLALLAEPDLDDARRIVLREWLGSTAPAQTPHEDPGLLIAIDRIPESSERFQLLAWRWPDRLKLWPPIGEESHSLTVSEIPHAIHNLYDSIHHQIARFGGSLRVELLLHHSLLTEPAHEWKISVIFDDNDPDDIAEQSLYVGYPVVVRSAERALSPKPAMVDARARWRERWSHLPAGCKRNWQRPQEAGAFQRPPFFCSTASEEFAEDLYDQLSSDHFLCFVETVAPPEGMDFIKKVLLRVVRAGVPFGLWFARNADRSSPIYEYLDGLLEPQQLPNWPRLLREHWKHAHATRPLLFFDDPTRMPYDPDNAAFESPSAS